MTDLALNEPNIGPRIILSGDDKEELRIINVLLNRHVVHCRSELVKEVAPIAGPFRNDAAVLTPKSQDQSACSVMFDRLRKLCVIGDEGRSAAVREYSRQPRPKLQVVVDAESVRKYA